MLQHELLLSTDLGRPELFKPAAFQRNLESYLELCEKSQLKLSLILGQNSESQLKHIGQLENVDIHFRLPAGSLLEHCIDALLESPNNCFLQEWQVVAPLERWKTWIDQSNWLYENTKTEGFYRFHPSCSPHFPYLVHPEGKAHLRTLFRDGKWQNIRDFDWRNANFVAESSFNKTEELTQRA
jgi:hypothetical protein